MSEEYPYPIDTGRTHWEGCFKERGHHNCAVAEITRLRDQLAAAQERLWLAERIIPAWQDYHGNCSDPDTALQRLTAMMREWRAGK